MARDDFSAGTIRTLATRVAYRCSNCRVPTSGPGDVESKATIVGDAAHIHAASPGGPRYLATMTPEARKSIDNGIWLCAKCARTIDSQVATHPAELLLEWKATAEARARHEMGKALPAPEDAVNQVAMALTGLPTKFAPTAIANVHQATSASLESRDPRFRVETSFDGKATRIVLHAKERVNICLEMPPDRSLEWADKLADLVKHGKQISMDAKGLRLLGSPIFEITEQMDEQRIVLVPNSKDATLEVQAIDPGGGAMVYVGEATGKVFGGRDTMSFEGVALGAMLSISLQKSLAAGDSGGQMNFVAHLDRWEGRRVSALPYFEKIAELYRLLAEGWRLDLKLSIEGQYVLGTHFDVKGTALDVPVAFLDYTRRARVLSRELNQPIDFKLSKPIDAEDNAQLEFAVAVLEGRMVYTASEIQAEMVSHLTVGKNGDNVKYLLEGGNAATSLRYLDGASFMVFNQEVQVPPLEILLNGVTPKLPDGIETAREGDPFCVEWVPQSDFLCTYRYMR